MTYALSILMLLIFWFAHLKKSAVTGHLLKNGDGHLVKDCGCQACPGDCSALNDVTVTLAGFGSGCCAQINAAITATRTGCTWSGNGNFTSPTGCDVDWDVIDLSCSGDTWTITLEFVVSGVPGDCDGEECDGQIIDITADLCNTDDTPNGTYENVNEITGNCTSVGTVVVSGA